MNDNKPIRLSDRERKALTAFDGLDADFAYLSFRSIAGRSGLDLCDVRRTVRSLARKGMTVYGRGLWTDEGEMAGSGYAVTEAGRENIGSHRDSDVDTARRIASAIRSLPADKEGG